MMNGMPPKATYAWSLAAILLAAAPAFAQPTAEDGPPARVEYNDYYQKDQTEASRWLLDDVETYHFGPDNFWRSWKSGAYAYAKNDLLYTLRKYPNHPKALHMLGELAKATNDLGLPIVHYEKAIRLFPSYAYTHAQYGQYLIEIGAVNAGMSELRE